MSVPLRFQIVDEPFELGAERATPFTIASMPRPYGVSSIRDALGDALTRELASPGRTALVVDANVERLHLRGCALPSDRTLLLDATEENKTLERGVADVLDLLTGSGISKGDRVIVVGGGIVQDICAFACALQRRGVPWTFYPSTLLAMSDSCIGAKAGLNRRGTKNLLGLFSAPARVVLCPALLDTLDDRAVLSGLGEVLKLHVTAGDAALTEYDAKVDAAAAGDRAALEQLALESLFIKRAVIERDEFEQDLRRALNYGHTIGHMVEALTDYAVPHGQAVAIGMAVVNDLGHAAGILEASQAAELFSRCARLVDPASRAALGTIDRARIADLLARDKKADARGVTLVVPKTPGHLVFHRVPIGPALVEAIDRALSRFAS